MSNPVPPISPSAVPPIFINGTDGDDSFFNVPFELIADPETFELIDRPLFIDMGDGNDANAIRKFVGRESIMMFRGDDTLLGGAGPDRIDGYEGDDSIDGGPGNDFLAGSDGNDTIYGRDGEDGIQDTRGRNYIDAGPDNDVIIVGGQSTVHGGTGDDEINMRAQSEGDFNQVFGDEGNDTITSVGPAGDYLDGGSGRDSIEAADGDDTVQGGLDVDYLDGGNGVDILSFKDHQAPISFGLGAGGNGVDPTGDTYRNFEGLEGTAFNDSLSGNLAANILLGGSGNDTLIGGGGADTLDGGDNIDLVSYASSGSGVFVELQGGLGQGGDADLDTLINIENLEGSAFGDALIGDDGANALTGLGGDDTIKGVGGADALDGGMGNDTLVGGAGNDILDGGEDNDTAIFAGKQKDYSVVNNNDGTVTVTDLNPADGDDGTDTLISIETLVFETEGEDPVITPGQTFTYAEGQDAGFVVGTVRATDNTAVTAFQITGGNDASFFTIDGSGTITLTETGAAALAASNDFETTPNGFTLTIEASDEAQNKSTGTVQITVQDADDTAPTITPNQSFTYDENQAAGYIVGTVAATDDTAVTGFEITGGNDESYFAIDGSGTITLTATGAAALAPSNDFETTPNTFTLTIEASDAVGNKGEATVDIAVQDVDDEAPVVTPNQSFTYDENQAAGFVVGTVAASDNTAVTGFEITGGNDESYFAIDGSGTITLTAAGAAALAPSNDFETTPNAFTLTIEASDAAGNKGTSTVGVSVTDLDDNAPTVTPNQSFTYDENQAAGYVVGTVAATDNTAVTGFEITGGSDKSFFAIDAGGTITLTAAGAAALAPSNDFETTPNAFNLTVEASDAAGNKGEATVTISVQDVDDEAPVIEEEQSFSYYEGQVAGYVVGTVSASDNTAVTGFAFTQGNEAGYFAIGGSGTITLTDAGAAAVAPSNDFETTPNAFNLTIAAADAAGNSSQAVVVTVTVQDVVEIPEANSHIEFDKAKLALAGGGKPNFVQAALHTGGINGTGNVEYDNGGKKPIDDDVFGGDEGGTLFGTELYRIGGGGRLRDFAVESGDLADGIQDIGGFKTREGDGLNPLLRDVVEIDAFKNRLDAEELPDAFVLNGRDGLSPEDGPTLLRGGQTVRVASDGFGLEFGIDRNGGGKAEFGGDGGPNRAIADQEVLLLTLADDLLGTGVSFGVDAAGADGSADVVLDFYTIDRETGLYERVAQEVVTELDDEVPTGPNGPLAVLGTVFDAVAISSEDGDAFRLEMLEIGTFTDFDDTPIG